MPKTGYQWIKARVSPALLARSLAVSAGFIFGFGTVLTAETINGLKLTFQAHAFTVLLVALAMPLGCWTGVSVSAWLSDKLGDKLTLLLSGIFIVISIWGSGFAINAIDFFVSQLLGGAAIGVANMTALNFLQNNPNRLYAMDDKLQKISVLFGFFAAVCFTGVISFFVESSAEVILYLATWRWIAWIELLPAFLFLSVVILIYEYEENAVENSDLEPKPVQIRKVNNFTVTINELDDIRMYKSNNPKLEKIVNAMEYKKMYLVSRLNIEKFSKQIDMDCREVSLILNKRLQMNFFEFVNIYRVEEVKRQLSDKENEKTSISKIVYDSGFNSTSSFHRFWSRYVGVSPTEYRKHWVTRETIPLQTPIAQPMQASVSTH